MRISNGIAVVHLLAGSLALAAGGAHACTTILVGKAATVDRSVLMATSCDGNLMGRVYVAQIRDWLPAAVSGCMWLALGPAVTKGIPEMKNRMLRNAWLEKMAWTLLVVATAFAATGDSSAAEYFVARSGSDAADGRSEKNAWASIGKRVALLKPGDVLTILPGTYFEAVSARISGKPGAPIVVRAKRPGTVLLRGDMDAPRFRRLEGRQYTYATDFKPLAEGIAERSTRRLYEPMLSLAEVELTPASFYQDPQVGRLYVHASDSANPDWHALGLSVTNGFGMLLTPPGGSPTVHDVVIDGLSFTGYQWRAATASGPRPSSWPPRIISISTASVFATFATRPMRAT